MQSQVSQIRSRRRHDGDFKARVIAACREPGASVAAVAQSYGLNANLVRKWLVGRGLKRCGLQAAQSAGGRAPRAPAGPMQFVPVQLPSPSPSPLPSSPAQPVPAAGAGQAIEIELTRAAATLTVRWPAAQAQACAGWLGELVAVLTR